MIFLLRGHIRRSFEDKDLYHLLKQLHKIHPLSIYIHTWSRYSSNISWRHIDENNTPVTEELVRDYFEDLSDRIRIIKIEDDQTVPLIGNIEGNVGISSMPVKGWKNYWYGQFSIMKEIYNLEPNKHIKIVNTRFDVLTNSVPFSNEMIDQFIRYNLYRPLDRNIFIASVVGVDNVIIGTINTMYKMIRCFSLELDNILLKFSQFKHHEQLVSIVNDAIFKKDKRILNFH